MKMRVTLRIMLMTCLMLLLAVPAMADVTLPKGLVEIESKAFIDSAWLRGSCNIPEGVTTIGSQAFYGCSGLTSLSIPDSVTYIGSQAFCGCTGLTGTITLPKNAVVADDAFANCPNLTVVSAADEIDPAELFKWTTKNGQVTITSYIGKKDVTSVTVPAEIDGKPVTTIGDYAFSSSRYLTSIVLPDSVKILSDNAFSYCANLQSISMPIELDSVGDFAFYYCSSLSGVLQIVDAQIGSNAFTGCKKLTALCYTTNADGTLTLSATTGSQTTVKVPASCNGRVVTVIGGDAFARRSTLQSVELPRTITKIGNGAFYACSALSYIDLPDSVTSIGGNAFYNCTSLESINMPASLKSIGTMAFLNCRSLYASLSFVDVEVGLGAFGCCGDVEVWCYSSNTDGTLTLVSCDSTHTELVVPYTVNGRSVVEMAPRAFYASAAVETVSLPNSFRAISDEAFYNCKTLRQLAIPTGVTSIGYNAFSGCTALTAVEIPSSVRTIDSHAFYGCKALKSVSLSNVNTTIGSYAFAECTALTNIALPANFHNVGTMAFQNTPWLAAQYAVIAKRVTAGCTSDYARALALHDWLVENTAYDLTYAHSGAEDILFYGVGICNAYATAYNLLLDAVGIQNMLVYGTATDKNSGTSGSHAWTLAKISGSWYHIDTTWDDPIPNGRERHTYFCINDAKMAQDHQWVRANYPAATSTSAAR